jgi:iduronate 2-sulfatase
LKQLGLEENTVVVFWADHGWNLGEHGQWMKQSLFEPSARVPLIFAGPSVKFGGVCHRTVEHLDIYPTLAEVCQLENVPTSLQGTSLAPLLHNPEHIWDRPSISQVLRTGGSDPASKTAGYSIRSERYRYTSWHGAEEGEELYDYREDPHELRNRAADPAMREIRMTMKNKLDAVTVARGRLHES